MSRHKSLLLVPIAICSIVVVAGVAAAAREQRLPPLSLKPAATVAFAGFADDELIVDDSPGYGPIITSLRLPHAGSYVVFAKLQVNVFGGAGGVSHSLVRCKLQAGADFDTARLYYHDVNLGGFLDVGTLTLSLVHRYTEPNRIVSLACSGSFTGQKVPARIRMVKITAIKVDRLFNGPMP
jgi:hypothetical protein